MIDETITSEQLTKRYNENSSSNQDRSEQITSRH